MCPSLAKARKFDFEWLIFEELFQQTRGKVPLLKTVSPMTPICVALFAGHSKPKIELSSTQSSYSARDVGESHSDSESEPNPTESVERSVMKWPNVGLEMASEDEQIMRGILRLREDWKNLFDARMQPKKYGVSVKDADELVITTLRDILVREGTLLMSFF